MCNMHILGRFSYRRLNNIGCTPTAVTSTSGTRPVLEDLIAGLSSGGDARGRPFEQDCMTMSRNLWSGVDTTLTVRLYTQLKEDAERTLGSLGMSMASAIRVLLPHVVAHQAL